MQWQDVSSYSRGERGKKEPTSWETRTASLRITITRKLYDPGRWYVACHEIGLETLLVSETLEGAKQEGLERVRRRLREWLAEVAR